LKGFGFRALAEIVQALVCYRFATQ
jgi:hypothetical protein